MGRPSKYTEEFAIQATKLCRLGATDKDLADFFDVNTSTIWRWSQEHEEFCNALKVGKEEADSRVERSLYHRANGYSFEAVKIFMPAGAPAPVYAPYTEHVAPDTTACIFWLKNRRPDLWRDVTKHEHGGIVRIEKIEREIIYPENTDSRGIPTAH
jgi:hypothetical protein